MQELERGLLFFFVKIDIAENCFYGVFVLVRHHCYLHGMVSSRAYTFNPISGSKVRSTTAP